MVTLYFFFTFYNFVSTPNFCCSKRLIEFYYKIISEILRYSSAVFGCIACYYMMFFVYLNKRSIIKCIHYNI